MRFPYEAHTRVALIPSLGSIVSVPLSYFEEDAVDISCDLVDDGLALGRSTIALDGRTLGDNAERLQPIRYSFDSPRLRGMRDTSGPEALWDAAVMGDEYFLVVRYGPAYDEPWAAGQAIEVYAITFGVRSVDPSSGGTAVAFTVPIYIHRYSDSSAINEGGDFDMVVGTQTGQIPVWDNDAQEWIAVMPVEATAADIPVDTTGLINTDATDVQGAIVDLDGGVLGGVTVLASDQFSGGDDSDIDGRSTDSGLGGTGRTWSKGAAGNRLIAISSGALVNGTGSTVNTYAIDVSEGDVFAYLTVDSVTTSTLRLLVRQAASDDTVTHYSAQINAGGVLQLQKTVSPSGAVNLGSAQTWADGDVIGVKVTGTTVELWKNGLDIVSVTDSAIDNSNTKVGLRPSATAVYSCSDLVVETA